MRGARKILQAILRARPHDADAHALLAAIAASAHVEAAAEVELPAAPPVAAEPRQLGAEFRRALGRPPASGARIRRLARWLARVAPESRA